ncbi:hypothetical protein [Endozoicomonas lisbonensis]|uniref:Uncharacterized protein n=1 Tax=Endozoicomonas lisbonensis TaxID=3120522 RepID=A0ABV2SBH1_9GAMM
MAGCLTDDHQQQIISLEDMEQAIKSGIIESWSKNKKELTGVTAELAGIIDRDELNTIDSYTDHLQEKYF